MANRDEPSPERLLPKHVRFARVLALASGAAVGIAISATVFTSSSCMSCAGSPCGDGYYVPPPAKDAQADIRIEDGGIDARGPNGGGGPTHAPALPADWLV
jgi:hypothetical protein